MLVKLGIWNEVGTNWQLDATFRNNLTGAIFGGLVTLFGLLERHFLTAVLERLIGLMKPIQHQVQVNVV